MINFKDRMTKRGNQQPQMPGNSQWPQQSNLNRTNSRKDLYKQVTSHLSSQQFEAGDFRRPQGPLIQKKRNSILEMQCQQDIQLPQAQQQYYTAATQRPRSMLNSNINDNYNGSLFESKLHETKGELCEQIVDLEKRIKRQIQRDRNFIEDYLNRLFTKHGEVIKDQQKKNFDNIVTQLNKNLNLTSKRQKSLETSFVDQQQKIKQLTKQFSEYTLETEEKIQKIMNSNALDAASSMKKSFSRNMGNGDYVVELKSSIKDIPVVNNQLVEDIRNQMHEVQEAVKMLKFQVISVKDQIKNRNLVPMELQTAKPEAIQIAKVNMLGQQINNLKFQISSIQIWVQQNRTKYKQLRSILQTQQQNYKGMNTAFERSVNVNIGSKIKKIEEQLQKQSIQKHIDYLKKQTIRQLESMPIIRVKHLSQEEKQKIQRMKTLPKSQQLMYMIDEQNCILDCFGNYILDEMNQKIKLLEEQVYYLETIQGIQIKMPVDVK